MRRWAIAAVLMLVAAACSDDGGTATIVTATTDGPTTDGPTTDGPTSGAPASDPAASTVAPAGEPVVGNPHVAAEPIGDFDSPVDLAVRPGDEALYVVEQPGRVVRFDGTSSIVLDLTGRVGTSSEQGLLGLAFSADGARAYVDHTDLDDSTVITEYSVEPDGALNQASERVLLTIGQPFRNHNAGDLEVDSDGMLYITLGDGGSGGDPARNGSDPTTLLGSILRIDPTPSGDAPYTVPPDNPFAAGQFGGVSGAPEVWAWGLRNPWKIAFDPVTGELWIADVGQNRFEEIDVVAPVNGFPAGRGVNFGWSAFEGTERFNTDVADSGTTPPVLTYEHGDDGCSISGGVPYRGAAIAELEPAYVYSDFCSGVIWAFDRAGGRNLRLVDGFSGVTAVRSGPDGELYVLEQGGTVHRLVGET